MVSAPGSLERPNSLTGQRVFDFWLLGGASILLWLVLVALDPYRQDYSSVGKYLQMIGPCFGILSLLCNYPHFMVSYHLAYGRGFHFIGRHYLTLIVVPVAMVALFAHGFFNYRSVPEIPGLATLSQWFALIGVRYEAGSQLNLGLEVLSLSAWIMYVSVGWHYSKQVFGATLVYAHYDRYVITKWQRESLRYTLFAVAFYNFCFFTADGAGLGDQGPSLLNFRMSALRLPEFMFPVSRILFWIALTVTVVGVFGFNYWRRKQLPTMLMLTPFVAFLVWWIPMVRQLEFYIFIIPFFHSLQYLPFAWRVERGPSPLRGSLLVLGILATGYFGPRFFWAGIFQHPIFWHRRCGFY
jgi:hypothetical protein